MNTKNTTKPGTENKTGRLFHPAHAGTCFKVMWEKGGESGCEEDVYTSLQSAVEIAESLQLAANDRPHAALYFVIDQNRNVVHRRNQ